MEKSMRVLKVVVLILFFNLLILFFNQSSVKAVEVNTISTMEELKAAFGEKAIIDGSIIKLTDNIILEDSVLNIKIPEVIIDFNGKTIECKGNGGIGIYNKVTFKDSSTTNRLYWGGFIFNHEKNSSINVNINAELIINNGKFVDGGIATTGGKLYVAGKLTINDATFSTTRTEPAYKYNYMISLSSNSECVINSGEFSHSDSIIYIGGSKYSNKCKLTINGGNFNCLYTDAIEIMTFYPYVDKDNNKKIITPKITLNNCNINAKHTAIGFWGGCTDGEFKDADTKILTILGGTYKCSAASYGSVFEIRTYANPNTYFNPKDFVLQGGTFESLNNTNGAIRLIGPRKR